MDNSILGSIMGSPYFGNVIRLEVASMGPVLLWSNIGLYRDNGKENGTYHIIRLYKQLYKVVEGFRV